MDKPRVSIIVLTWNEKRHVLECLDSLRRLEYPNLEIIVVDNGSTDGTQKIIKEKFPELKLIQNKENLGFAEGNNIGARHATGDYLLFLNNDTVVDENMINELVKVAESDDKIAILGPKIYFYDRRNVIWFAGGKLKTYGTTHYGFNEKDVGQHDKIRDVDFVTGCALMIRKSMAKKIGLFDPFFFIYYEDLDLSLRAREAGYRVIYAPKAVMWHKCHVTMDKMSERGRFLGERNILLVAEKHKFNMLAYLFLDFLHTMRLSVLCLAKGRPYEIRGILKAKIWFLKRFFSRATHKKQTVSKP